MKYETLPKIVSEVHSHLKTNIEKQSSIKISAFGLFNDIDAVSQFLPFENGM